MMPGVLSCTKTPTPPYLGRNLDPAYITTLNPEVFQCFFFQGSVSKLLHPGAPLQSPSQVTSRKDLQKIEGFHLKRLLYLALEIRRRFHVLQDAWNIYTYCSTTFLRTHTWWIQRCVCVCVSKRFSLSISWTVVSSSVSMRQGPLTDCKMPQARATSVNSASTSGWIETNTGLYHIRTYWIIDWHVPESWEALTLL